MADYHLLQNVDDVEQSSVNAHHPVTAYHDRDRYLDNDRPDNTCQNHEGDSDSNDSHQLASPERELLNGQHRTTTNLQALMHLLKGNIGTGILALPSAFHYGGLWLGFVGVFVMGGIAIHCMHLLVSCARFIRQRSGHCSVDYGEVMMQSFTLGPQCLRRFANLSRTIVDVFLCITQFGFCTVYILFVADNICQVLETFTSLRTYHSIYQVFVALLLIPYLSIRRLKLLSPFSLISNILTIVGLVITLQYCFQGLPSISTRPAVADISTIALYFGIVVFAFEGIGVVLPIEDKMKTPGAFSGWFGIINVGMTIAMCLYAAVGFFGYLRFGDEVHGSITLDLPCAQWLYAAVKLMFAIAIFFTYGIQFYVPIEILWPPLRERFDNFYLKQYGEYLLRFFFLCITSIETLQPVENNSTSLYIVFPRTPSVEVRPNQVTGYKPSMAQALLLFVLAATIPHLDLMISLVGTLSSSAIALIFPPLLDLVTFSSDRDYFGRFYWRAVKDGLIMLLGLLGFIIGTAVTINQIALAFTSSHTTNNSTCSCDSK